MLPFTLRNLWKRLSALYFAGLHALGADVGFLRMAIFYNGHFLDIRAERAVRNAVRVANVTSGGWVLATNRTYLRHFSCSLT